MRCLVLADALEEAGHSSVFYMTYPGETVARRVRSAGHRFEGLSDAREAVNRVVSGQHDCVVVDSYDHTDEWDAVRTQSSVVVIDDGADRLPGYADLAVNPSPSLEVESVGDDGRLLRGPKFALVHGAFSAERQSVPPRRPVEALAIVMGATDAFGHLDGLSEALSQIVREVHICGITSDEVGSRHGVVGHGFLEPSNLAALLAGVDLVVSSASTLTWEICALRKPAVFLRTADNQRLIASWLRSTRIAPVVETVADAIDVVARIGQDVTELGRVADRLGEVTDGQGPRRVVEAIEATVRRSRRSTTLLG